VTNPRRSRQSIACAQWLQAIVGHGSRVLVPKIADYEVRRVLLRANKVRGLARLDALIGLLEYLPLTTAAMRKAAEFWAQARRQGRPTADDKALDGDVILAAQAMTLGITDVVIATTNVGHLSRFAPAALWPDITATS
jgi:predicted nucleic acid-binding protein